MRKWTSITASFRDIGRLADSGQHQRFLGSSVGLCAFFACAPIFAQQPENRSGSQAAANAPVEIEQGIWPSPKLMQLMLTRWAEEAGYEYDLDDQQREKTRKAVVDRWTKFLDENRDEIQPLTNEFLEMRMEITPPTKSRVQEWARRAKPVFEKTTKQLDEGTAEYRAILRPNQRIKFEIDAVQMKVGLGLAQQKFIQWEKGDFEPDDFWEPIGPDRDARREERKKRRKEREAQDAEREQKRKAADEQSTNPIDAELDSWQQYVADFISAYGLDAGQQTTAQSCLTELRSRAIAHRDRYRDEIARLEDRIAASAGTDEELGEIKDQLNRLYGPIDDMFKELQTRLEQVPTGDQRASAKAAPKIEAKSAASTKKSGEKEVPDSKSQEPTLNKPATPPAP